MASYQDESKVRTDLKTVLKELAALKPTDLSRMKDLGPDLNFEAGVAFFSRTLRLFHALDVADLEDIPYSTLGQLVGVANEALAGFRDIQNFSLSKYQSNPIATRDQFINRIRDAYDSAFNSVAPTVAFLVRKGTDFERLEEQAKTTIKRIDEASLAHEEAMKASRKDAELVVQEVRRIAREAGVSQHAFHFKDEADGNEASARPWLRATIGLASGTLLLGVGLIVRYLFVLPDLTGSQSVQLAIPKIFIFSVLLSATIWTGKTYRACRHNAIVNRHRQNALATFETFAKAASDDETKNAVLLQATQCIFSPQQTGYIHAEPETAMPPVLEIVRSFGKSG